MSEVLNLVLASLQSDDGTVKYSLEDEILKITINPKQVLQINISTKQNNITCTDIYKDTNSVILCGILNSKKHPIHKIMEFIDFLKYAVSNITNFCIGCYKKMEFQSDRFITCGSQECNYIFEELHIGDPVIEKIKDDPNIVKFLLESAFDAITCARKYDIFEPFPKHFLKNDTKIKRGEVSKLVGVNYDNLKDFNKLNSILKNFDIDKFFDIADVSFDDEELRKNIGTDVYNLIRFIITSNKTDIIKDDEMKNTIDPDNKNLQVYKIIHPIDKENEFKKLSGSKVNYLFHGSNWCNWYSNLRNGLKNCSSTALMTAGAAYGNGIYLSNDYNLSYSYGLSGSKSVVGVFEIADDPSKYMKGPTIFVVPNEKILMQRYFIMLSSRNSDLKKINTLFSSTIHKKTQDVKTTIFSKGVKKLIREYKNIKKQNANDLGFRVEVDKTNAYLWYVFIFGYDKNEPIGKDMTRYGIDEIKLEVNFPSNYPFSPPFIRVIFPRFEYQTGHVTSAGALCMQILTEKHWDPACSMESLIVSIKSEILQGGGRLDTANWKIPYSEKEAKESFIRVARGHRWI